MKSDVRIRGPALALVALAAVACSGCFTQAAVDIVRGREDREFASPRFAFRIEGATLVEPGLLWLHGIDASEDGPAPWHVSISLADAVTQLERPGSPAVFVPSSPVTLHVALQVARGERIGVLVPWAEWRPVLEPARGVPVEGDPAACTFLGLFRRAGPPGRVRVTEDVPPLDGHDPSLHVFALRPLLMPSGSSAENAPVQLIVDASVSGRVQRFEISFLENPKPPRPNLRALVALPLAPVIDVAFPVVLTAATALPTLLGLYTLRPSTAVAYGKAFGCGCVERPLWFQVINRDGKTNSCYTAGRAARVRTQP